MKWKYYVAKEIIKPGSFVVIDEETGLIRNVTKKDLKVKEDN